MLYTQCILLKYFIAPLEIAVAAFVNCDISTASVITFSLGNNLQIFRLHYDIRLKGASLQYKLQWRS